MTLDNLINIVKKIKKKPVDYLSHSLLNELKVSSPQIQKTFFPTHKPNKSSRNNDRKADLDNFPQNYLAYVISTISSFGFNNTIKPYKVISKNQFYPPSSLIVTGKMSFGNDEVKTYQRGRDLLLKRDYVVMVKECFQRIGMSWGNHFFMDYILQPEMLGPYFAEIDKWKGVLEEKMREEDFRIGFWAECESSGSTLPAYILSIVCMHFLYPSDPTNFESWKSQKEWFMGREKDFSAVQSYRWMTEVEPLFRQNASCYNDVHSAVTTAIGKSTYSDYETSGSVSSTFGETPWHRNWRNTFYGTEVLNWLNSKEMASLRSKVNPSNVVNSSLD